MLLSADRSQVLIIDMQEKFIPALHQPDAVQDTCIRLVKAAKELNVPVTYSEQYPKGLGPTVPDLKEALGNAPRFEKMHFSCAADESIAAHIQELARDGRDQLIIAGVESHVCVLQSAIGFFEMGLAPAVVMDGVTSRSPENVKIAAKRLDSNGVEVVSSEMVLFEWMKMAGTPSFKAISKLVK